MHKTQFKAPQAQAGFTLIELIVVIVILGIMAATALPKFTDMSTDARIAKMQAAAGSIKAAAATAHAQWLLKGADDTKALPFEGGTFTMTNGYPKEADIAALAGLTANDYDVATAGTIKVDSNSNRANCKVVYAPPTAAGNEPTITLSVASTDCD